MNKLENKQNHHEYVEAVPGPAIVISRETYNNMQKNNNANKNNARLKRYKKFFQGIKYETKKPEEDGFSL